MTSPRLIQIRIFALLLAMSLAIFACDDGVLGTDGALFDVGSDARIQDARSYDADVEADVEADASMDARDGQPSADVRIPDVEFEDVRPDADATPIDLWPFVSGQSYFGTDDYIEYIAGDAPIVLVSGHGGYLTPESIPDRTYGSTLRDVNTQEITREFAEVYFELTGKRPHMIISLLHRVKLDPNREVEEAAQGDAAAILAWEEFHAFIEVATERVSEQYEEGFLLDIHGHSHTEQRVELGYLLTKSHLRRTDAELNQDIYINRSSVRDLYYTNAAERSFAELIRGEYSWGALLEAEGFPSVPSPSQPAPEEDWAFFAGGPITGRHGSRDGGRVSGMQVEINRDIRWDDDVRPQFTAALARAAVQYMAIHYEMEFGGN